jgi:ATP-dependent Clp protease ATP-binding subunit ClpA
VNRLFGAHKLLVSWEIPASVVHQFEVEAKRDDAKSVEAEHMLLALATNPDSDAAKLLHEFGLDHDRLASALLEERRRTLAFAGIAGPDEKLVEATELDSSPSFGTSAKAAVRRALIGSRHDRRRARLRSTDLLAGILEAELGTVPRALAIAGIDRAALIARARELAATGQAC